MLVIQHNCAKAYATTIAALEAGLALNAAIICLQEPYTGQNSISHPGYVLYWPEEGDLKNKRVVTAVRRDLIAKTIIEARTDLINHPYAQALDIWDLHRKTRAKKRRTRLINVYDNRIGLGTCYKGTCNRSRRAIEDINWDSTIQGRVVLLGDFNAHSPVWNPLISTRKEAGPLEQIIEDHGLILNNEPGAITRPGKTDDKPGDTTRPGETEDETGATTRPKKTRGIIDLTFTTVEIGPLESWAIERENLTPSDHELIVLEWADLDILSKANRGEITG